MADPAAFWPAMLGAAIGGGFAIAVQRWRFTVDRWQRRVDAFCKDVSEIADLGMEYWLKPGRGTKIEKSNQDIDQIRLRGRLERLETQRTAFVDWCCDKDRAIEVDRQFAAVQDKITGGEFSDRNRKVDGETAFEIQALAADLLAKISNTFAAEIGWWSSIRRIFRRRKY